jgi:hypothetical protein
MTSHIQLLFVNKNLFIELLVTYYQHVSQKIIFELVGRFSSWKNNFFDPSKQRDGTKR